MRKNLKIQFFIMGLLVCSSLNGQTLNSFHQGNTIYSSDLSIFNKLLASKSDSDLYNETNIRWSNFIVLNAQICLFPLAFFSDNEIVNDAFGVFQILVLLQSIGRTVSIIQDENIVDYGINIFLCLLSDFSLALAIPYHYIYVNTLKDSDRKLANFAGFEIGIIPMDISLFTLRYN